MSETKGCLGWIAATIGWFVLWGLCMSIGDAYKISPFGVLFMIVIGTLVIAGIGIYFYTSTQNKIYKKHNDRVKHIQEKYSLAYLLGSIHRMTPEIHRQVRRHTHTVLLPVQFQICLLL
jgi:hypothetical protein